jgi:glycosyltransferase 2 family protein
VLTGRSRYLGFLVTIVCLGLLLWKVNLREVADALAAVNYVWVAPAIGCTLLSYTLRTIRWGRILRPIESLPFRTLLPVLAIGFMANNLLPARMGELVRAYALGRKVGLSKSLALATILLERLCDGITLVAVLGLVALLFPLPDWARQAGYVAAGLFLAVAVVSLVALAHERVALRLLGTLLRPLPEQLVARAQETAASFVAGLRVLQSGRDLLAVAGWSVVIWSVELTTYLVVLRAVHPTLQAGTPLVAALLLMVMVNLGTLIPSAPGYIGAFQFFGVLALSAFGVPASSALAVAIVAHAVQWLTVTVGGLIFVARESLNWQNLVSPVSSRPADAESIVGAKP